MEYYVYAHIRKDTNKIFYIGKGKKRRAYVKSDRNSYWKAIVDKHGYEVKILIYFSDKAAALSYEKLLIKKLRRRGQCEANLTDGGDGGNGMKKKDHPLWKGYYHTPKGIFDTALDASNANGLTLSGVIHRCNNEHYPDWIISKDMLLDYIPSGQEYRREVRNPRRGFIVSEETKEKLRVINTGKKHSEETKRKIGNWGRGRKMTKTVIERSVDSRKKWWYHTPRGVFDTVRSAFEANQMSQGTLCKKINSTSCEDWFKTRRKK